MRSGRRREPDGTAHGIERRRSARAAARKRQRRASAPGHVTQPPQDTAHAAHVILHDQVRYTVRAHHARTPDLRVRGVHFAPEHFVQRGRARENQRRLGVLNHALAQTRAVRANADAARGDVRQRDRALVRAAGRRRDLARALQALHALTPAHVRQTPAHLARVLAHHAVCEHAPVGAEHLEVVLGEVHVLEPLGRLLGVHPRDSERGFDRLVQPDARARVGGDVHAGEALRDRQVERRAVHRVFFGRERAGHVRDVVCHQNNLATVNRVLVRDQRRAPAHHPDVVHARGPLRFHQASGGVVQHELDQARDAVVGHAVRGGAGVVQRQRVCENLGEVVGVR
mmetsp:Transcript_10942/g.45970  ORF Transcript_10942/g.45970 Transcript_10942/m.45970 type:complete len:341 (+) Transcript_10942:2114-3136(+)